MFSLLFNELFSQSHAVSRIKMPPVREFASSLLSVTFRYFIVTFLAGMEGVHREMKLVTFINILRFFWFVPLYCHHFVKYEMQQNASSEWLICLFVLFGIYLACQIRKKQQQQQQQQQPVRKINSFQLKPLTETFCIPCLGYSPYRWRRPLPIILQTVSTSRSIIFFCQ